MVKQFDRAIVLLSEWTEETGERFLIHAARTGWWELPWCDRDDALSYRQTAAQALCDRFQLNAKRDFIVCSTPRLNLLLHPASMDLIDRSAIDETGFGVVEIYPVQLFGKRSRAQLENRNDVCWLASSQFAERQVTPQTATPLKAMQMYSKPGS